jgi:hypothetical protein
MQSIGAFEWHGVERYEKLRQDRQTFPGVAHLIEPFEIAGVGAGCVPL